MRFHKQMSQVENYDDNDDDVGGGGGEGGGEGGGGGGGGGGGLKILTGRRPTSWLFVSFAEKDELGTPRNNFRERPKRDLKPG